MVMASKVKMEKKIVDDNQKKKVSLEDLCGFSGVTVIPKELYT